MTERLYCLRILRATHSTNADAFSCRFTAGRNPFSPASVRVCFRRDNLFFDMPANHAFPRAQTGFRTGGIFLCRPYIRMSACGQSPENFQPTGTANIGQRARLRAIRQCSHRPTDFPVTVIFLPVDINRFVPIIERKRIVFIQFVILNPIEIYSAAVIYRNAEIFYFSVGYDIPCAEAHSTLKKHI